MKKPLLSILFFIAQFSCFCQSKYVRYDSLIRRYNYLNHQTFAELELEDTSGSLVNTSSLVGKTIYVDFWFTTCAPCIKEIPYSKSLQQYFSSDTNIVFLSICIENWERKTAWKQMVKERKMPGIQLFYPRNRPQKINLLRKYEITFPTYLILNKRMEITGYDAPRPSETGWVHWSILKGIEGKRLSNSYLDVVNHSKEYTDFIKGLESK